MNYKFNKKRFVYIITSGLVVGLMFVQLIDFFRFPECYLTCFKYQLQCDIEAGDKKAIEYYNETYIANGRELFEQTIKERF